MKRRSFLAGIAALFLAPKPSSPTAPAARAVRHWNLFDVAWIEHAGMSVCIRAGTDETALWQKSEKWERAFREDRYLPRRFMIPVRTAEGISTVTYEATSRDAL